MPKTFADTKQQMLFLIMVCKLRGMSLTQIRDFIEENIHEKVAISSIRNWIFEMESAYAEEFHQLKASNSTYIANIMEIKKHIQYYKQLIMQTLTKGEFKMHITPRTIYGAIEELRRLEETEFKMLKEMPELFAWSGGSPLRKPGGVDDVFSSQDKMKDASLNEYVLSLEQIPIPDELLAMQQDVEDKNLSAHEQKPVEISSSSNNNVEENNDDEKPHH